MCLCAILVQPNHQPPPSDHQTGPGLIMHFVLPISISSLHSTPFVATEQTQAHSRCRMGKIWRKQQVKNRTAAPSTVKISTRRRPPVVNLKQMFVFFLSVQRIKTFFLNVVHLLNVLNFLACFLCCSNYKELL